MGIFDWLFKNKPEPKGAYQGDYKLLTGYTPHFSRFGSNVYESEIVRAAIGIRATHISKLRVETQGSARRALQAKLKHAPNQFQTWSQFLYRLSTILDMHNTAFIVPDGTNTENQVVFMHRSQHRLKSSSMAAFRISDPSSHGANQRR